MKKNLLTVFLALGCAFVMSACTPKGGNSSTPEPTPGPTPLSAYTVAGQFMSKDGEHAVEWNYTEQGKMEESTVEAVKAIDPTLGAALEANEKLEEVYVYEGALLGCTEGGYAGWTAKALVDGEVQEFDGGYAVKAIQCDFDYEDEKWLSSQWIPDPHTACAENLTPDTLFLPTWQEEADEHGFKWNDNPVCIGGAGEYTIVVAKYDVAADETKTDQYNYGMALVKTEGRDPYEPAPILEHTFGLIGNFEGNSWASDVAQFEKSSDGVYELTYNIAADVEFKVRADGAWTTSFGYGEISEPDASLVADPGNGNIKAAKTATFQFTLNVTFDAENNITGGHLVISEVL